MDPIMNLTDDTLTEVLSKLPLKSLARSKGVSKPWCRLISHNLIRGHRPLILSGVYSRRGSGSSSEPRYGSLSAVSEGSSFTDCNHHLHRTSNLTDCCNGLLLFASRYRCSALHVCCPATDRWVSLPEPGKRPMLSVLAFDPCRSPYYKVVSFTGWREKGAELEVFSSESGKWAEREVEWAGVDNNDLSATMRYFDGALHILAHPQSIVRVDLESMTCRCIELPEGCRTSSRCRMGAMAGGHISYATSNANGSVVKVWALDGNKWLLKHSLNINQPAVTDHEFNVLGFDPDRGAMYIWVPGKIVAYDLVRGKFEDVCELKGNMKGAYVQQVWLFPFSRFMSDCLAAGLDRSI